MAEEKLPTRAEDFSEWYNQLVVKVGKHHLLAGRGVQEDGSCQCGLPNPNSPFLL